MILPSTAPQYAAEGRYIADHCTLIRGWRQLHCRPLHPYTRLKVSTKLRRQLTSRIALKIFPNGFPGMGAECYNTKVSRSVSNHFDQNFDPYCIVIVKDNSSWWYFFLKNCKKWITNYEDYNYICKGIILTYICLLKILCII